MLDLTSRWPDGPDWANVSIKGRGIAARPLSCSSRHLVSGNLDAFLAAKGLPPALGALGIAPAEPYALRLARDRMMVVGAPETGGWHAAGFAVSDISAAFQAFAIDGAMSAGLIAHATMLDPGRPGPSCNVPFAGHPAMVHRQSEDGLVVHVERGLAAALWAWLDDWSRHA